MSGRTQRHYQAMITQYHRCDLCQEINISSVQVETAQFAFSMLHQRRTVLPYLFEGADFTCDKRHLVRTISGHSEWVRCAVPSDDGRLLASASKDKVSLHVFVHPTPFIFGTPDCETVGSHDGRMQRRAKRA